MKKHSARNAYLWPDDIAGSEAEGACGASRGADTSTGPINFGLTAIYPHETH